MKTTCEDQCDEGKIKQAIGSTLVKWLKVSRGIIKDKGTENCPLCKLFYINESGHCENCPIKKITNKTLCCGTPYEKWIDHHNLMHSSVDTGNIWEGFGLECPECKELARDMFYFILDLIEMGLERTVPQAMLVNGGH